MLGNGRCECFCFDGVTRLGHIRGKMRKKVWITAGDIILVAKRDFQDEKVDIVHKYSADEARNLKQYGELPETARINETAVDMAMAGGDDDDDIGIDFDVRVRVSPLISPLCFIPTIPVFFLSPGYLNVSLNLPIGVAVRFDRTAHECEARPFPIPQALTLNVP